MLTGAVKATVADPLAGVAFTAVGASGAVKVVICSTANDARLGPTPLVATTLNV